MDRLAEVADLIRRRRAGPAFDEIVQAAKSGLVTEQEAIRALERDFEASQRYRQERETPIGVMIEDDLVTPDDAEGALLRGEATNLLLRVINDLPPRQAQCCELYYFGGLTQEQVGQRLGIPRPNVSAHMAVARGKLRAVLARDCTFHPLRTVTYRGPYIADLMADPLPRSKHSRQLRFPFEVWLRWSIGGAWRGHGVYATRYQNRLPQYLAVCFGVPPVVGWFSDRMPR